MNSIQNLNVPAAPLRDQINNARLVRSSRSNTALASASFAKTTEKENRKGIVTMISEMSILLRANLLRRKRPAPVWMKRAGLAVLASVAGILPQATAQTQSWQPYGMVTHALQQFPGAKVRGINTGDQLLTSNTTLTVYKSPPTDDTYDYYLVAGPFSHAVTSADNINGSGTGYKQYDYSNSSEYGFGYGWCGATMNLNLEAYNIAGATATLLQAQPASTTDLKSTTTSASLTTGGVDIEYQVTSDAPDVGIATDLSGGTATFAATLQCPSLDDAFLGKLPHPTSEFGTTLQVAAVYQVPHGTGLRFNWNNDIVWQFFVSWTPQCSQEFCPSGGTATASDNIFQGGSVVADFGASPTYKNGKPDSPANGPQIIDEQGYCLTAQKGSVSNQACHPDLNSQKWYYTANSQIVNVGSGTCLDIAHAPGAAPVAGDSVVLNACSPALPTVACIASGTCSASPIAPTQQWQAVGPISDEAKLNLTSSSGLIVYPTPQQGTYMLMAPPKVPNRPGYSEPGFTFQQ